MKDTSMRRIYYLPVDESIELPLFNCLCSFISSQRQEQIKYFHFNIDKKLSLYAELIVMIVITQILGNKTRIEFRKGKCGKPYVKGYFGFNYNISHTRNAVTVAVADLPIGIDVEKITGAEMELAYKFFTLQEQEYISENHFESDKRFYEIWTRKEAYIKYTGKGLSVPLNSFNVLDNGISKRIQTFEREGYIISVCCGMNNQKYELTQLSESQVEKMAFSLLYKEENGEFVHG